MERQTENYLDFSDEILESLIDIENNIKVNPQNVSFNNLWLVENVIDEYCSLLMDISKESGPEFVELGNIALDILKTSMHLKTILEKSRSRLMYAS